MKGGFMALKASFLVIKAHVPVAFLFAPTVARVEPAPAAYAVG